MEYLLSVGSGFQNLILRVAGLLKHSDMPGWISLGLVAALTIASLVLAKKIRDRLRAIAWLNSLVSSTERQSDFSRGIDTLTASISSEANTSDRKQLATAWGKYRETLVPHEEGNVTILRNSIRPAAFLNLDDLGFNAGAWRIGAGLFVTVGLFLTFLGLVSALRAMTDGGAITSNAMSDLLKIASAKFIMSLTGLFCSIVFTIIFRTLFGKLERSIHRLCAALEKRLAFISLEALAVEQLAAIREQREHFRLVGMELVAELGRPLREELPAAISTSIRSAMAPLMEQVGKMGSDGVEGMVKNLSSQLADDVGRSLGAASERLAEAGTQIKLLADRMDQSSGRMGAEMESSIAHIAKAVGELSASVSMTAEKTEGAFSRGAEQLLDAMNRTLEGIRDNTGEGARAMSAAAAEMRGAAEIFKQELEAASRSSAEAAQNQMAAAGSEASGAISAAGTQVLDAFGRTTTAINRVAKELSDKAASQLLEPLVQIAEKLHSLVASLSEGSSEMRRMSEGVRAGGEASSTAATAFRSAAVDMVNAASPIRSTTERIEAALRSLSESTHHVANSVSVSAKSTAQTAADTLSSAEKIMSDRGQAIEIAMKQLGELVIRMQGQGNRLDELDDKLGSAFDRYDGAIAAALDTLSQHAKALTAELNPALETMREIVDQAQTFIPESRVK